MKHFIDPKLLERLSVGALAPYLEPYLARIKKDGFALSSVPCQAYAIARFSRWLNQQRIQLKDVDEAIVQRFLQRAGVIHRPEPETIQRLLLILRENGVVADEPAPRFNAIQQALRNTKIIY